LNFHFLSRGPAHRARADPAVSVACTFFGSFATTRS
jgi:hypothetical protein